MKGLLPDSIIKNKKAEEDWTDEETDKVLLNPLFAGSSSERQLGFKSKRGFASVHRRIWEFQTDRRDDKPIDYVPTVYRESRRGERWNAFELRFLREWKKNGLPIKKLGPLMQRDLWEIKKVWNEYE